MKHILCKTILLISIIFAIISLTTPHWAKATISTGNFSASETIGLFTHCDTINKQNTICEESSVTDNIKMARNLIIISILCLVTSLISSCMLDKNPTSQIFHNIGMVSYILGIILMCIGIIMITNTISQNSKQKFTYGYSFYTAIMVVILAVSAGVCRIINKN